MNSTVKIGAAIAAVLIIAIAGWNLLPGRETGVGGATSSPLPVASAAPSPTSSAVPSVSPSAGAVFPVFPSWFAPDSGDGILSAGSHTTTAFAPGFTYTVPEGWVNGSDETGFYQLFQDTPANAAELAASDKLAHEIYMGPHGSPWFICEPLENNRGENAADMVTALLANEVVATSGVVDVAIGGLTGKQFDVRLDPDWTGSCPPRNPPEKDLADERVRGILLDSPDQGVIVIFLESLQSAGHEAFLAEAMPIIESFQFDTGQ